MNWAAFGVDVGSMVLSAFCWYKAGWYRGHIKGRRFERDQVRHPSNGVDRMIFSTKYGSQDGTQE